MTKTLPFLLLLLSLLVVKPTLAETSVNVSNSSSGNCNSHIKITTNGVTKEINSTDCSDISLSSDDSNPSSTSQPTSAPTSHPTSTPKPTYNPTSAPTTEPTDSASPSASPTATPSAEPSPTPEQKSGFEKFFDQVIGLVFNIFDGK